MRNHSIFALRVSASIIAAILYAAICLIFGIFLSGYATGLFSPEGVGSADPRGRGGPIFDDGLGFFIPILFSAITGWMTWLATDRKNWSTDLFISAPIFLVSGPIAAANWLSFDGIFTRDAQAFLNILLVASGLTVSFILQASMSGIRSKFLSIFGACILGLCIYSFVAIPMWYSLSFLSWKLGGGELDSLDSAAKAVGAIGSLLAVLGVQWKDGRLGLRNPAADAEK